MRAQTVPTPTEARERPRTGPDERVRRRHAVGRSALANPNRNARLATFTTRGPPSSGRRLRLWAVIECERGGVATCPPSSGCRRASCLRAPRECSRNQSKRVASLARAKAAGLACTRAALRHLRGAGEELDPATAAVCASLRCAAPPARQPAPRKVPTPASTACTHRLFHARNVWLEVLGVHALHHALRLWHGWRRRRQCRRCHGGRRRRRRRRRVPRPRCVGTRTRTEQRPAAAARRVGRRGRRGARNRGAAGP